jgi:transcriptional regulator with XRE-family HTH domain
VVAVDPPVVTFAGLLRQLRMSAGLSQEELAQAAGVGGRTVSDLERGVALTARKDTARLLADALRLTGAARASFEAVARGRTVPGIFPPLSGGMAGSGSAPNNPFTYGNPISDPRRFFGRAREVEQIFGRLRNEEFESSSVVGDRRIGKTSLLNYLADPGVRAAHGLGPEHYNFVYVDLQMVDKEMGPEQLWHRLLVLMRQQCADDRISRVLAALERRGRLDTFDLDELFQEVDDSGRHVVFLLDEFEHVTRNVNFGPDFYYGFRSLMIHHKVALVTSSRLELIELCHSETVKSSPFFNIFANINLRMFSDADGRLMISRSLCGSAVQFSERDIGQVLDLAGLHPYFLQAACCMLYESYGTSLGEAARKAFLAENFRAEAMPHFVDYWDNSGDYERISLTAAALLERPAERLRDFSLKDLNGMFSRAEPSAERLEKRGLLMSRDGRYRLFSSVLGPWVLSQFTAEPSDEQDYHEWLAENDGPVERITGEQGGLLREILPMIGARYRQLVISWARDPQSLAALSSLLTNVLGIVK